MLSRIKEFFLGDASIAIDASGTPSSVDLQTATGILLLEMAAADHEIADDEMEAIFSTLQQQFDIGDDDIKELIQIGSGLRQNRSKVNEFIGLINDNFADDQRRLILAMVWKVVIADGKVDDFEKKLASELMTRLNLSHADAERARKMAEIGDV